MFYPVGLRLFTGHTTVFLLLLVNFSYCTQIEQAELSLNGILQQIPTPGGGQHSGSATATLTPHPLDPLTESEIRQTTAIIQKFTQQNLTINYMTLKEPEKALILPYFLKDKAPPAGTIPRKSFSVIYDPASQRTYEIIVNLNRKRVETFEWVQDGEPNRLTDEEIGLAETIMREHPEVIARCKKLGFNDMNLVFGDSWSIGYVGDRPDLQGRRLIQLYVYLKFFPKDNEYLHPGDFLVIVDVGERRVFAIEDYPTHDDFDATNKKGNVVAPNVPQFDPAQRNPASYRKDLHPVKLSQPGGPSFTVNGNEVSWQKFKFRVGFSGLEGVIIHTMNYKDGSQVRPLFYRMSLAQIFVPYGDPRPPFYRKIVNDLGEYGMGFTATELTPQLDCIGELHLFNFVLHDDQGQPVDYPRIACLHEEDAGILWKHYDARTDRNVGVRSQRLALTFTSTVGNYDYLFTWHFYEDATIEFSTKLSGMLSLNVLAEGSKPFKTTTRVFPGLYAQNHQHFITLRLDPEIDGNKNSVAMVDVVPLKDASGSPGNPYGNGFAPEVNILRTAGSARTNINPQYSRQWHIRNDNQINPNTETPAGWKLVPWPSSNLLLKKESPIHDQNDALFLDYSTWVTPFNDEQIFPAGLYSNQSGLPQWVRDNPNANVENTDIVLWYNFGIAHVPRVEDFPVMPVEYAGVTLKPLNFFAENPALDVRMPADVPNLGWKEL